MSQAYSPLWSWEGFPHVLHTQQFSRDFLDELFSRVDKLVLGGIGERQEYLAKLRSLGVGKTLLTLFYESSSRTETTFLRAAQNIGMDVISVRDPVRLSSEVKGESLEDSIRTYGGPRDTPEAYRIADAIVIRHPEEDRPGRAARMSGVPVINAGNGPDQHPTQSLVDLYAVRKYLGKFADLHVGMVGDLKNGRTARSMAYLLGKIGLKIRFTFIAHRQLQMRGDVCEFLARHQVPYECREDYGNILSSLDLLYLVRLQAERQNDQALLEQLRREVAHLQFTPERLHQLPEYAIVLHPLPINSAEKVTPSEVAEVLCVEAREPRNQRDPRIRWFDQCDFGIPVRMALLTMMLGIDL